MTDDKLTLERTVPVSPERIWELWTTPEGINQWWAPDGFRTDVEELDLRPGGVLVYTMTTVAPEQIAFMQEHGMPLSTRSRKTFIEVEPTTRLAYRSLIDFVPNREPYEHLTVVDLVPVAGDPLATAITMTIGPLHDEEWTQRLVAGRSNELDNLVELVTR